jgi:hypothetical protein
MTKNRFAGLIIVILGLFILGVGSHRARADVSFQNYGKDPWREQMAAYTDQPTPLAISEAGPTPEVRVLPPVWSNAGLVLAASVLVLIIVGGVLGVRLREKH